MQDLVEFDEAAGLGGGALGGGGGRCRRAGVGGGSHGIEDGVQLGGRQHGGHEQRVQALGVALRRAQRLPGFGQEGHGVGAGVPGAAAGQQVLDGRAGTNDLHRLEEQPEREHVGAAAAEGDAEFAGDAIDLLDGAQSVGGMEAAPALAEEGEHVPVLGQSRGGSGRIEHAKGGDHAGGIGVGRKADAQNGGEGIAEAHRVVAGDRHFVEQGDELGVARPAGGVVEKEFGAGLPRLAQVAWPARDRGGGAVGQAVAEADEGIVVALDRAHEVFVKGTGSERVGVGWRHGPVE